MNHANPKRARAGSIDLEYEELGDGERTFVLVHGFTGSRDDFREQLPELGESLQGVPELARNLVEQLADGRFNLQVTVPEIEKLRAEQMAGRKQQWRAIAGASTLLSGVLLLIPAGVPPWLAGTAIAAGIALLLSARS